MQPGNRVVNTYNLDYQNRDDLDNIFRSDISIAYCKHRRTGKIERIYVVIFPALIKVFNSKRPIIFGVVLCCLI